MAALASKGARSDEDVDMSSLDEWVKYDASDECERIDHARAVVFVDGVFEDFPNFARIEPEPPKSNVSRCVQYLYWLNPDASFYATESTFRKFIDIRERNGKLYFFRAAGFFYFGNPAEDLPAGIGFHRENYDIDYCMQHGAYTATTLQAIAFYYMKILPPHFKLNLYIHKRIH